MSSFVFHPDLYRSHCPEIKVISCHQTQLHHFIPAFLASTDDNIIGLAPTYGPKARLVKLAIASRSQAILIDMTDTNTSAMHKKKTTKNPLMLDSLKHFLCSPALSKYAFEMDKLATSLFLDWGLHITCARDLLWLSAHDDDSDRYSSSARMYALGGQSIVSSSAVKACFCREETVHVAPQMLALQAWSAGYAASLPHMSTRLAKTSLIDTSRIDMELLGLVAKVVRDASRLRILKPTQTKNDVENGCVFTNKGIHITSQRFRTRVMRTRGDQILKLTVKDPEDKLNVISGKTGKIKGRSAKIIASHGNPTNSTIQSLETIGREQQTSAENLRAYSMLQVLQGTIDLSGNPFICEMWLGNKKNPRTKTAELRAAPAFHFPTDRELNASQKTAVNATLSSEEANQIVVIHGPPGTGKTTVIAATVTSIMASSDTTRTIWLVAQSNVAVKNIAEKLALVKFYDFKILVSHAFHFDWHEHLYERISMNVIRSDEFEDTRVGIERQLLGSRVILCTLSMLSNIKLGPISQLVPLQTVIFDEASQVEIGDYLPLLVRFRPTLRRLVFIGDDKQLAPYGSSDITNLESIFEKGHLRKRAIFLNTQYRMPVPIGNFISKHVYSNKLRSQHLTTDPLSCRFVNVSTGIEESHGHSWKNIPEINAATAIARRLSEQGKSFRIITPYDPQRSLLEVELKKANLRWEDKCFNIDAFQGNEDDYIIISLVRSHKLGFLRDMRRVNVMLTRCKKGMVICTSRKFVEGPAAHSLIGKLSKSLPDSVWADSADILNRRVELFPV